MRLTREVFDTSLISYSSLQFNIKNLQKLPSDLREKAVQHFTNESDLKSDEERDLLVFSNNYSEVAKKLSRSKKDFKDLADLYSDLLIGTMPGDFYDMNDGFPILSKRTSRRRIFMNRQW